MGTVTINVNTYEASRYRNVQVDIFTGGEVQYRVLRYKEFDPDAGQELPFCEIHKRTLELVEWGDTESGPRASMDWTPWVEVAAHIGRCDDPRRHLEYHLRVLAEACPGCGCMPGDGETPGCNHPAGCGHNRANA